MSRNPSWVCLLWDQTRPRMCWLLHASGHGLDPNQADLDLILTHLSRGFQQLPPLEISKSENMAQLSMIAPDFRHLAPVRIAEHDHDPTSRTLPSAAPIMFREGNGHIYDAPQIIKPELSPELNWFPSFEALSAIASAIRQDGNVIDEQRESCQASCSAFVKDTGNSFWEAPTICRRSPQTPPGSPSHAAEWDPRSAWDTSAPGSHGHGPRLSPFLYPLGDGDDSAQSQMPRQQVLPLMEPEPTFIADPGNFASLPAQFGGFNTCSMSTSESLGKHAFNHTVGFETLSATPFGNFSQSSTLLPSDTSPSLSSVSGLLGGAETAVADGLHDGSCNFPLSYPPGLDGVCCPAEVNPFAFGAQPQKPDSIEGTESPEPLQDIDAESWSNTDYGNKQPGTSDREAKPSRKRRRSSSAESDGRQIADIKNKLLVECRKAGLSYKDIKTQGNFVEAESTLRGRYRALTKEKHERVRAPVWRPKDRRILRDTVQEMLNDVSTPERIPWKRVAEEMVARGASYHFAPSTCKKKWHEIVGC